MTVIEQLAADHEKLLAVGLPPLRRVWVELRAPEIWNTAQEAEQKIAELERKALGWIRRQSATDICPRGTFDAAAEGAPLAGEWLILPRPGEPPPTTEQSADLRYASGVWRLIRIVEHQAPAAGARDLLRQDTILAATRLSGRRELRYAVYWGADPGDPAALRRLFARFTGFDD
jgi:hypothetical protein